MGPSGCELLLLAVLLSRAWSARHLDLDWNRLRRVIVYVPLDIALGRLSRLFVQFTVARHGILLMYESACGRVKNSVGRVRVNGATTRLLPCWLVQK